MINFLNDNAGRAFPFVTNSVYEMTYSGGGDISLPKSTIVDATFVIYDESYDYATDRIYLHHISRTGDQLSFAFRCTSPDLQDAELSFCRTISDDEFATSYATEATAESLSISTENPCAYVRAEGWLTTGELETLLADLADGATATRSDMEIYVEPARVQNLANTFAKTINLANADRTRIPAGECEQVEVSSEIYELETAPFSSEILPRNNYHTGATCLTGAIRFKEGHNIEISQDTASNTILIGGVVGGGTGEPCAEIALFDDEIPPSDSTLLSGGPTCGEVIKTIQGLGGPRVFFLAGTGITIEPSVDNPHKLLVNIDSHGLARCSEE